MSSPHKIDTGTCWGNLNFYWCDKDIAIDKKKREKGGEGCFEQSDHTDLPKRDDLEKNFRVFEQHYKRTGNVWKSMWLHSRAEIIFLVSIAAFTALLNQSIPYILGLLTDKMKEKKVYSDLDKQWILIYFVLIVVITRLSSVIGTYFDFRNSILNQRLTNCVGNLIYQKIFNFNMLNKSGHGSSNIINYIQTDSQRVSSLTNLLMLTNYFFGLIFGMVLLNYYLGWICWVIFGVFCLGIIISSSMSFVRIRITKNLMKAKDHRVAMLEEVINNIKFIKTKAWENFFQYKLNEMRDNEIKYLLHTAFFNGGTIFINWLNNGNLQLCFVLSITFWKPELISIGLVSAVVTIVKLFYDIQFMLPNAFNMLSDLLVSMDRLKAFLKEDDLQKILSETDEENPFSIQIENMNFGWVENVTIDEKEKKKSPKSISNKSSMVSNYSLKQTLIEESTDEPVIKKKSMFSLERVCLQVRKGELVFLVGEVGSGKSSLLHAVCQEMEKLGSYGDSCFKVSGKIAFLSQSPWILGTSVLKNIVLGQEVDQERLQRAVRLSQLETDIGLMQQGLDTFVGENGSAISGGQRTRLALARCIYQDPDIYVLDDPLSALDLNVANKIMQEAILGELAGKTRIISTHAVHLAKHADRILSVKEGSVQEIKFAELSKHHNLNTEFANEELGVQTKEEKGEKGDSVGEEKDKPIEGDAIPKENSEDDNPGEVREFLKEDKSVGNLQFSTLSMFFREMGGFFPMLVVSISIGLLLVTNFYCDYYHIEWAQYFDPDNKMEYMYLLIFLLLSRSLMSLIRTILVYGNQLLLSRRLHAKMSFRILHAPITQFLERVPAGRIINRFTKDLDVIDSQMGNCLLGLYLSLGSVVFNIGVIVWTVGFVILIPLAFFFYLGYRTQRRMMQVKREIVRLQGVSKSPVLSNLGSLLKNLSEIRVLEKQKFMWKDYIETNTDHNKNTILNSGLDAWYQNRINFINVFLVLVPGFAIISYFVVRRSSTFPLEKLVLFMITSMRVSKDLTALLISVGGFESNLVALERCSHFANIKPEPKYLNFAVHERKYMYSTKATLPKIISEMKRNQSLIVLKGQVDFKNVSARYPFSSKNVLSSLTFRIDPGKKVGVVGRTGAGKTSLIKLFWMCLEPSAGTVIIDGKDVTKVDLKVLRSSIDIITQETAFFEGTLRENLDPTLEYCPDSKLRGVLDKKLEERLKQVGFKDNNFDENGLNAKVNSGGSNLSLGQKQLLSFIRILTNPKKLMILDEATANIDLKTEKLMHDAVHSEFTGNTMFIIAHRIQTVLECDLICVMDAGRIVELDSPDSLIKDQTSAFFEIYNRLKTIQESVEQE